MYPVVNIRKEGIVLREFAVDDNVKDFDFQKDSFESEFIEFAKEVRVARDVKNIVLGYLKK